MEFTIPQNFSRVEVGLVSHVGNELYAVTSKLLFILAEVVAIVFAKDDSVAITGCDYIKACRHSVRFDAVLFRNSSDQVKLWLRKQVTAYLDVVILVGES